MVPKKVPAQSPQQRLKAVIYRGPASCEGCPESAARLLRTSPYNFKVIYAGPDEDVDITTEVLSDAAVYVQPGGGDLSDAWPAMKRYSKIIKSYVANGGRYMGFCVGAYLAGYDPGFGLLPAGADTDAETSQPGSQVRNDDDTIIQVDWYFRDGRVEKKRWMYFQDGATIKLPRSVDATVLARYSSSSDVAACITAYRKGWVGLIGPHPEADKNWYADEGLTNPDGIDFSMGYDFVAAVMTSD